MSIVGSIISDDNVKRAAEKMAKELADPVRPHERGETKSKRVNLLIKPSVYAAVQEKCHDRGVSVNEAINALLESWVNG